MIKVNCYSKKLMKLILFFRNDTHIKTFMKKYTINKKGEKKIKFKI